MTLLITFLAAIVSTIVWYFGMNDKKYGLGTLCLMYWGAALMWTVDAVSGFIELGADYFLPSSEDMLNDTFLGACAVALGLVIWLVMLLVKDPKGVVRKAVSVK
ncbi:MAG: hypothetical protein J6F31_05480 [Oscillospiraceae bacterium]|nr:hypothetical protein [Oscillospiraceae bacterium]